MSERELPVVDFDRGAHHTALLNFLGERYDAETLAVRSRVLDWIHERMPERDRQPLRHVIVDGDRVAGSMGYLPADFLVDGKRVEARFTHDLLVDPSYRGRGLAKALVKRQMDLGGFMPGGMWMTGPCYKLHLACGFTDMPALTPLTLVLDVDAFVSRRGGGLVKRAAQKIALKRLHAKAMNAAEKANAEYEIREIERFPAELDATWMDLLGTYRVGRIREAAHLNWKYVDHPNLAYRSLLLERGGRAAGYMIWRLPVRGSNDNRSVAVDFLVARGNMEAFRLLISRVIEESSHEGVEMVSVLSSQPWVVDCLRGMGFVPRRSSSAWVIAGWEGVCDAQWVTDPGAWHICMGDSDGDAWTGSQS
jgi:GNAT superfamily N-acetyltransferase